MRGTEYQRRIATAKQDSDIARILRKNAFDGTMTVKRPADGTRRYPVHVVQTNGLEFDYIADLEWRKGWVTFVTVAATAKLPEVKQ